MADEKTIVTLTLNPCLDISAEVDDLKPDNKLRCRNVRREPGGGGVNVSRAIALLGGRAIAVFPAGGGTGKRIDESLKRMGVDSHPVFIERLTRESFAVRELHHGEQYRFAMPGPELKEWQMCLQTVIDFDPPPAYLILSGSLPPGVPENFYAQLARHFADLPTKVILDTSGKPFELALGEQIYLIKPNQQELEQHCDCSLAREKDQEKLCRELVDNNSCEVLVLTLGKGGALLTTRDDQFRAAGIEVDEVSSVGAGDSFVGGMILALHRGWTMRDAFLYGMAAGTAAMLSEGTQLCDKDDTDRFFKILQQRQRG